ncbi:hypothetical protein D3C85_1787770 [compost metagenome]
MDLERLPAAIAGSGRGWTTHFASVHLFLLRHLHGRLRSADGEPDVDHSAGSDCVFVRSKIHYPRRYAGFGEIAGCAGPSERAEP